ncbi:hypothetical protein HYZ05_02960 [Candidatus Daviesbacteria bacterium]|nr:hypothetical protein [Candidatus Daviesbacteria bacterium]
MTLYIYFKTLILFSILLYCGITITKRVLSTRRAEIILPAGCLFGISLFLFLINFSAHFIKGWPLFYSAVIIQLLLTFIIVKLIKTNPLEFPQGKQRIAWFVTLFFWGAFFLIITNTSPFNGSDNTFYFTQASVFLRGDFPIHTPWQPDYVSYSHLGISQLLAAVRFLTGGSYHFIHAVLALISLFCSIQIITWILFSKKSSNILLFSLSGFIGFISLGAFMIVWPSKLALPNLDNGILNWLNKLPSIEISNASAGFLDPLIYILHRLVSTSIFLSLIPLLLYPNRKNLLTSLVLIISIASIALLDESVLISILPAIFLVSFFCFERKIKLWILTTLAILFIISFQGGIIKEAILNRYHTGSGILIFPADNPNNPYENFRSLRLHSQASTLFEDLPRFQPFRWLQIGIIWQLLALLIIVVFYLTKKKDYEFNTILALILISSLSALIAYHGLVPKLFHTNGWRFLAISYQLSGIGIGFFIINWWLSHQGKKYIVLKILILWILIFSLVPPFARLFPRRSDLSWFKIVQEIKRPSFEWIKNNLPVEKRIVALTDGNTIPSTNMDLATQIGVFTPVFGPDLRAYENFDAGPSYVDLYYTLNPGILKNLKVEYLMINNFYYSSLPNLRKQDLLNPDYFQKVYSDPTETILKVLPSYIENSQTLSGTLEELARIAPSDGSIYIDQDSIEFYRAMVMTLRERDIYGAHNYWSRIEGKIPILGNLDHYDYLILRQGKDPKSICNCDPEVIWEGFGNGLKLWSTN